MKPSSANEEFWFHLDELVSSHELVIDRPKGATHPRYPGLVYPVDYGYLEGTSAMDGGGIDVWLGESGVRRAEAIICTVDLFKRDSEIKILLGCSEQEVEAILGHVNGRLMRGLLVRRA